VHTTNSALEIKTNEIGITNDQISSPSAVGTTLPIKHTTQGFTMQNDEVETEAVKSTTSHEVSEITEEEKAVHSSAYYSTTNTQSEATTEIIRKAVIVNPDGPATTSTDSTTESTVVGVGTISLQTPRTEFQRVTPEFLIKRHDCYGRETVGLPNSAYEDYDY
jgi:hypothetical protein